MDNARERVLDVLEKHARNSGLVAWAGLNGSPLIADLTALLTRTRAEGVAEAISECESAARDVIAECAEEDYVAWDTLESVLVERIRALAPAGLVAVSVDRLTELRVCLSELHAMVLGECPSLLNEDSGGDSGLDLRIRAAVARKEPDHAR